MLDQKWRAEIERGVRPIGVALRSAGVTADHLTAAGLVISAVTAVLIGSGRLGLGVIALVAGALPDLLDGAVAKASGRATARGAFFDSVSDRVSDSLVLGGVAWYYAGRHPHLAVLAVAVLALSSLISYERAKADSLGFDARGGLMERAERVVLLCVGLAFGVLTPALEIMAALTAVTAGQRFVKVWRQASATAEHEPRKRVRGTHPARIRWANARERLWPEARTPRRSRTGVRVRASRWRRDNQLRPPRPRP
jgi:CDP-diacylglycerol--glycerol-3-phosphate 3-phosphatidyltransferase